MKQFDFVKDTDKNGDGSISVSHTKKRRLDIGARIICLLIALIIWIYMVNVHETETVETLTLKIEVVGGEAVAENGQVLYGMETKNVVITVRGTNRDLKKYSADQYKATIDVTKLSAIGKHTVPITVKTPDNSNIIFVSSDPANVVIWCDNNTAVSVPLQVVVTEGEGLGDMTVAPSQSYISVSGPQSYVSKISRAVIEHRGTLVDEKEYPVTSLKFLDASDTEIICDGFSYVLDDLKVVVSMVESQE